MSRPVTGTVEFRGGCWQVKVTHGPGGPRRWEKLPRIAEHEVETAHRIGALFARRVYAGEAVPIERGETVKEYAERWVAWRESRGISSACENESNLRVHFYPEHAGLPMAGITKDALEDFVRRLDVAVRAGEMKWRTARNVWGTVSVMFDDAANAKDRDLRILPSNPAAGVRPPDEGDETGKQYLYPSEFLKLVSCDDVSLLRRRVYAFAVYTLSRAGEIVPFSWDDVNLDNRSLLFHEAVDRVRRPQVTKGTKGGKPRRVPIEGELWPLLAAMHASAHGVGRVFPKMPSENGLADRLRFDMRKAGVDRRELHDKGISTKPMTFHDLRATGVTWMAIRGDEPLKIQDRAGHEDFQTTQRYIRQAEALRDGFGETFPPLPASLFAGLGQAPTKRPIVQKRATNVVRFVGGTGIEPATSGL